MLRWWYAATHHDMLRIGIPEMWAFIIIIASSDGGSIEVTWAMASPAAAPESSACWAFVLLPLVGLLLDSRQLLELLVVTYTL